MIILFFYFIIPPAFKSIIIFLQKICAQSSCVCARIGSARNVHKILLICCESSIHLVICTPVIIKVGISIFDQRKFQDLDACHL